MGITSERALMESTNDSTKSNMHRILFREIKLEEKNLMLQ